MNGPANGWCNASDGRYSPRSDSGQPPAPTKHSQPLMPSFPSGGSGAPPGPAAAAPDPPPRRPHALSLAPRTDGQRQRAGLLHKARRLLSGSGLDEVVDARCLSGCALHCFVLCAWLGLSLALSPPAIPLVDGPVYRAAGRSGSASPFLQRPAAFNPIQELAMDALPDGAASAAVQPDPITEEAQPCSTEQGDADAGGSLDPQSCPGCAVNGTAAGVPGPPDEAPPAWWAWLRAHPPADGACAPLPSDGFCELAAAIAAAALASGVDGEAILAVLNSESGVQHYRKGKVLRGDGGRAIGIGQVHRKPWESYYSHNAAEGVLRAIRLERLDDNVLVCALILKRGGWRAGEDAAQARLAAYAYYNSGRDWNEAPAAAQRYATVVDGLERIIREDGTELAQAATESEEASDGDS